MAVVVLVLGPSLRSRASEIRPSWVIVGLIVAGLPHVRVHSFRPVYFEDESPEFSSGACTGQGPY